MWIKSLRLRLLLFPLLVFIVAGCGGGSSSPITGNGGTPVRSGRLEYQLSTTKINFALGEPVPLTFSVKNVDSRTVDLALGACDWFDTRVFRLGQEVWLKSYGHGCGATLKFMSLAPGETKTFSDSWPQIDAQGAQVAPGQYKLNAWFLGFDESGADPKLMAGSQLANESARPIFVSIQ